MAENIVSKGFYEHPGIPDFVSAKQYVIIKKGKENRLFFRFENPKNEILTAISFTVDCLDDEGRILKTEKITQDKLAVNGRSCFVVNRYVALCPGCLDFRVTVNSACYGNYRYVTHGNDVEVIFDNKKTTDDIDRTEFLKNLGGSTHAASPKTMNTTRFFSILVVAILVALFALLGAKIYDFTQTETLFTLDQVNYTFATDDRKDGPIIIIGINSTARNIVVPDEIEGHDVLAVESHAFSKSKVRTIEFQGSIEIKDYAFYGASKLTSVRIDSTEYIGTSAFYNCKNLKDVTVNKGLKNIGQSAFENCTSLSKISLPEGLRTVQSYAFYNCYNLTSLTIPDSTVSIGANVLSQCNSLEYLQVPFIGENIDETQRLRYFFNNASPSSLKTLVVTKMEEIEDNLFLGETSLRTVEFSAPVTRIGAYAFSNCSSLETFNIPETTESIGYGAFERCSALKHANIPEGVTEIGDYLFYGCSSLLTVNIPSTVTTIGASAFQNCYALSSLYIPASVTYIGYDALYSCTGIKELTLPFLGYTKEVTTTLSTLLSSPGFSALEKLTVLSGQTLPDYAFSEFYKLASVTLPATVQTIGSYSFKNCSSLSTVTIPEAVTSIGEYAFYGCYSLKTIDIPKNVTNVAEQAFAECASLSSAVFRNGSTNIGEAIFMNCSSLTELVLPSALNYLPSRVCEGCSSLKSIVVPASVTEIPGYAFYKCYALENVERSANITSIGNYAFGRCSSLTSFDFTGALMYVGEGAFSYCTMLSSVTIPETLSYVGSYVFDGCSSLETLIAPFPSNYSYGATFSYYFNSYYIPTSLKYVTISSVNSLYLPDNAFINFSGIQELNLPEDLTSIGINAFKYCSSLTTLVIPDSVTYMGTGMLNGTTSLRSITLPYAGSSSSESANPFRDFYYSDYYMHEFAGALEEVILTKATVIPEYAFSGIDSIRRINLPNTLVNINPYSFSYCYSLSEMTIPESVKYIGHEAFYECTKLYEVTNFSSVNYSFPYALRVFTSEQEKALHKITSGDYSFVRSTEGVWYLTSYKYRSTSLTLPSNMFFEGGAVKYAIPTKLFYNDSYLTSLRLSSDVTKISPYAFTGCYSLSEITCDYTYSFVEICNNAFSNSSVTKVQIPSSTVTIGSNAFSSTGITAITIPASVTEIGAYAFAYCYSLESVVFEDNSQLSSIKSSTFTNTALKSVTIPKSVTSIEDYAFAYSNSLASISFESGSRLESIGAYAFCNNTTSSITFPATLKTIGSYAYSSCSSLKSVSFKSGSALSSIGEYAFSGTVISECTLPASLTHIGDYAFTNTLVTSVTIPRTLTYIGYGAYSYCTALKTLTFESDSAITSIKQSAFNGCTALTDVDFGNNSKLSSIEDYAFYGCSALSEVDFGSNSTLSRINSYAFYSTKLSILDLPASLRSIGSCAFAYCQNLNSVTLRSEPDVSYDAFYQSNNIFEIYNIAGISITAGSYSYGEIAKNVIIIHTNENAERLHDVEINGLSFKKSDDNWFLMRAAENNTATELVLDSFTYQGNTVNSFVVYKNAFSSNVNIKKVTIGNAVSTIMDNAFYDCTSITDLTFDADCQLTSISNYAFAGCSGIKSLILPDSITEIRTYAFYRCSALEIVLIPKNVTAIGSYAFYECYKLYDVMNMSSINVSKETTNNGYVGYYALAVRKNSTPLAITTVTTDNAVAKFVKYSNVWYLIDLTVTNYSRILEIPKLTVDTVTYSYKIFGYALSSISPEGVIIHSTVTSISEPSLSGISGRTVYYYGSESEWSKLDKYGYAYMVYTYVDCVHAYGKWSLDAQGNVTTDYPKMNESIVTEPTCVDVGELLLSCPYCDFTESVEISPTGNHTLDEESTCTVCGSIVRDMTITVTKENFDTLDFISNDSIYPFSIDDSNTIKSSNKRDSSSSVLYIVATKEMTITFKYKVSSESGYDFLRIYYNNTKLVEDSGSKSYVSYSLTLREGDVLSIEYSKDTSSSQYDDCVYIADLVVETKEVVLPTA